VIGPDGICSACKNTLQKPHIDWASKKQQFEKLVNNVKLKKAVWDCVIPVSGGKDSTWQVITCLEYGLKPLCITWRTPAREPLGQANLDNLIRLGVDHFDISINPTIEKYFTLKTIEKKGSAAIPMHMALFALPLQIALKYNIPLVMWGENSAHEYGHTDISQGFEMNRQWLLQYGVTQGTIASDWYDEKLNEQNMALYQWPSDEALKGYDVKAVFLGDYFYWDPILTFKVAEQHGFQAASQPLTGHYPFADIDDAFLITLHHWFKWYKFGFTRLWDNLSLEIRYGRLTRAEAIHIIQTIGDETPHEAIRRFCAWAGVDESYFNNLMNAFRNERIWTKTDHQWKIARFLIPDWEWSA
jgi:N-acetyl sugar amidotransferase